MPSAPGRSSTSAAHAGSWASSPRLPWKRGPPSSMGAEAGFTQRRQVKGLEAVVTPVREAGLPARADPALVKALARAFRFQKLLDWGRYASISEMAKAERFERGCLGSRLRIARLPPEVVEAITNGRGPANVTRPRHTATVQTSWATQHNIFTAKPLVPNQIPSWSGTSIAILRHRHEDTPSRHWSTRQMQAPGHSCDHFD